MRVAAEQRRYRMFFPCGSRMNDNIIPLFHCKYWQTNIQSGTHLLFMLRCPSFVSGICNQVPRTNECGCFSFLQRRTGRTTRPGVSRMSKVTYTPRFGYARMIDHTALASGVRPSKNHFWQIRVHTVLGEIHRRKRWHIKQKIFLPSRNQKRTLHTRSHRRPTTNTRTHEKYTNIDYAFSLPWSL